MIALQLTVVTADSTETVTISPKVQVEFERQYRIGIAKAFQDELKVEYLYWLAWKSIHASGRVVKPFDSWLDDVVDVQLGDSGPDRPFVGTR
jgi:hypothetical protein